MARRIPANRFDDLVQAASEVFIARGYRLTQMSDVAEAMGVAKGTLYGCVESKEALFAVCLVAADSPRPLPLPAELPIPTPAPGELSAQIKERLSQQSVGAKLKTALARERADDPRAELEGVIRELYDTTSRNRRGIKLIDRCLDHPELGALWQTAGREESRLALARYIEQRVRVGQLRDVPNVRLAARIIIETIATWAIHIHWDRAPESFDPDEARECTIEFLLRSFLD